VVYLILKPILFFLGNIANLIQEGWFNMTAPSLDISYGIICFAFYILFCKGLEMIGVTRFTQLHVHTHMFCPYVISTPLPVTWRIQMRTFKRYLSHAFFSQLYT
jgi:hypothetical protein